MKKKFDITPTIENEKETELTKESWVCMMAGTEEETKVFFYNPKNHENEEDAFESFEQFIEYHSDNDFYVGGDNVEKSELKKENYVSISASSASMEEDYDEDSGKSWMAPVAQVMIMDFYKGGINKDDLDIKIKELEKSVDDVAADAKYDVVDDYEYNKDPYKYYGVKRSDFY